MAESVPPSHVSTRQVAEALGVSVSTVKRWVDEGILPAHKTPGGHRKLLVADVLELARRGDLPQSDLSRLLKSPRGYRPAETRELAKTLYDALARGDRLEARSVIHGAYHAGVAIEVLADEVFAPAMRQLGHEWEHGRIDVMNEHRGTQLCAAALYELMAVLETRAAKNGPAAIGGTPEGDPYFLATLLAQMVLTDAGWQAVNLGPNTPFPSFAAALTELRPRLVWVSSSHLVDIAAFVEGYRAFYQRAEKAGAAVIIGGQALVESVRTQIPYTAFGDGLAHLAAFARTLHGRPHRPRRGRPAAK